VQQEFQISVLDKKHFNRFWFFHPAPKFETLARRPRLRNKKIRLPKENPARIFKIKNKKKESKTKFQVYKKASSSPAGFLKNLHHPCVFKTTFLPSNKFRLPKDELGW